MKVLSLKRILLWILTGILPSLNEQFKASSLNPSSLMPTNLRCMKKYLLSAVILFLLSVSQLKAQINYSVPKTPWEEGLGNHRALINVPKATDVAHLILEWRRHDKNVNNHRFIIVNAQTNETVKNIYRGEVNNELCEITFGPVASGKYYFYYLPCDMKSGWKGYGQEFVKQEDEPHEVWIKENNIKGRNKNSYLKAECIELQARTDFNSFYPMEVIATEKEKDNIAAETNAQFLLFPEDRRFPIRMLDNIPQRWLINPMNNRFSGLADKNEYYVFQVGLWAIKNIEDVKVEFSDLKGAKSVLPKSAFTCFNTTGVDPLGKPFSKTMHVASGKVQPLWIGIDITENIPADTYRGKLCITTQNAGQKEIEIEIKVSNTVLADRGDSETWRHSRLRWLNSTAGINDENVTPYQPIEHVNENKIRLTGKDLELANNGLPTSIKVYGQEILSAPIQYSIFLNNEPLHFKTNETNVLKKASGIFIKEIHQSSELINLTTLSEVESDGWMKYIFTVEAKKDIDFSDIQLDIPFKKDLSNYMMGMGLVGTETPDNHDAKWEGPHDSFWVGNSKGGLYCELRGASYMGPLLNLYHPEFPESWNNEGKGGFKIRTLGGQRNALVYSGERHLKQGERMQFECAFIITPVKKLNTVSQFTDRYYHNYPNPDPTEQEMSNGFYGIKIINLHHANKYNPHINYPFIAVDELKSFVNRFHEKGIRVKVYYTIRELTNYVTEIWALRSLGNEIFSGGVGGGNPWLQEHFVDNYMPAYYSYIDSVKTDAAIVTATGTSRWYNYYVEGLKYMVKEFGIDGLYLDDVAYDRNMLKRMRKVMNEIRPDCLIDLHSHRGFTQGPAIQYTEYFPYIDKLWFGENFNYDQMSSSNWFVESSGIPFGLMGDMLEGGGNAWRGMIYGMTSRYPWAINQNDLSMPYNIWKVWDNFGIASSEMLGYWDDKTVVSTSNKEVLATAYLKNKKMLISVASWANEKVDITLNIDFKRAGLNPDKIQITAPAIDKFQPERTFGKNESIPVEPKKGWLLILEEK